MSDFRSRLPWLGAPVGLGLACAVLGLGCDAPVEVGEVPGVTVDVGVAEQISSDPVRHGPLIVAHGGQGSPASRSDGPALAVDLGFERLGDRDDAVAAAIAVIESLEDDPRFNAGTGANLRLDGHTIEADAAIMSEAGFGAVAGLADLRHPIRAAEAVVASPHLLLAGEGAQAFAATLGLERRSLVTDQARAKLERGYARLFSDPPAPWASWDWRARWNFSTPAPADLDHALAALHAADEPSPPVSAEDGVVEEGGAADGEVDTSQDTVGVVVRSGAGRYAAALSTGGTTLAIHGRVGDVPLLGAGLYAGPHGAVAATGKGEAIIRERVAARVYDLLAAGQRPSDAIEIATRDITVEEGVGVIAVSELGWGASATTQMAWAARDSQRRHRADTWIQHLDR